MNKRLIKLSLFVNYFLFAILLNSVGIVILKSQNVYGVDEVSASVLEMFKDFPIAIVSFLTASFLPRIGYKRAMLFALGLVMLACISMYMLNVFWATKLLFASIGAAFALIKMSVYAMIGLVTDGSRKSHNALMSSIEGVFMFGIALAYFLFPAFNDPTKENAWLNVYLLLAAMALVSFAILYFSKFTIEYTRPSETTSGEISSMFKLITKLLVIVFLISAFLFVLIEQGIMTWLPTFNSKVLKLSENLSITMASILAISLGVGRLLAGFLSKYYSWFWIITICIFNVMIMVLFVLPIVVDYSVDAKVINHFSALPLVAFIFPLVGLFIAPIYPLINSNILSSLPTKLHSAMSGWIIIFSAIGGTVGSIITGYLFKHLGAEKTFYFTVIPIILLLISLIMMKRLIKQKP